jgi:hypothetical protein
MFGGRQLAGLVACVSIPCAADMPAVLSLRSTCSCRRGDPGKSS